MKFKLQFIPILILTFLCNIGTMLGQQKTFTWASTGSANWATSTNWATSGGSTALTTAAFTAGATSLTLSVANSSIDVGDAVSAGTGVTVGTTITSIDGTRRIIGLSAATTASGSSVTFTFVRTAALNTTNIPNSATDIVSILNGGSPVIFSPASYTVSRVNVGNNTGAVTGSTLTINLGATLNVSSAASNNVVLTGGNIVNNGALNITSTGVGFADFPVYGINCANPAALPTTATTYRYSGNGTLSVTLSGANFANAAAFATSSNSTNANLANATYELELNNPTITLNQSTALAIGAIRTFSATSANNFTPKLTISGTGLTLGTVGVGSIGSLISVGNATNVTVNTGTTLTLNSATANVNSGLEISNSLTGTGDAVTGTNRTRFTNNGTINIKGNTSASGIRVATFSGVNDPIVGITFENSGLIDVDINATVAATANATPAAFQIPNGFGNVNANALLTLTNNGIINLKNTSTAAGNGFGIWVTNAGERTKTTFNNNGIVDISGSVANIGQSITLNNNATINSNSSFNGFVSINNNTAGSINFTNSPAVFTVDTSAATTIGAVYRDANLNVYTVNATKVTNVGLQLLASVDPISTISATGTLTRFSGAGDATIAYTAVTTLVNAITSPTTNAGTINTGKGSGASLSAVTGVISTTATSVISPGGATANGIVTFPAATQTILGKLNMQVSGNGTAGVDFDQINSSAANGGFDISAATLEISSLYTPTSSVVIPILVASGSGTISGPFTSVTGLTAGWTISYASPTSVILIYTVVVIPTVWTGAAADNNFFTEANWRYSGDNSVPAANTINPGVNINLHLQISSSVATINSGAIQFGTGSLAISSANLNATSLSGGNVTVNDSGYVTLSSATPLLNNVQINFTSGIGWIKIPNYNARAIADNNIGQIKVNFINAVFANNLRLDHYYFKGCIIRANLAGATPLTVYDSGNLAGIPVGITVNTIHSGAAIANAMNNKIESFLLKKGFMVTIAIENDGTGKSKNYIASEEDLVINVLPQTLQNAISFIRVMPWNWATKKGFNSLLDSNLDASWRYQWNPDESSTLDYEFEPMAWGHTSANDPSDIAGFIGRYNTPHVMSFNEPDDCDGQSGQYGNLCQTDVAVGYHKNLMKTGMRIVSPAGREEAPFGWLEEFYNKATVQDIRVDVIAVHWYDWRNNPTVNTNPTAMQVFNRFKAYLTNVHNLYGLPIWITEFNANPARSQAINAGFLELALPYLESLDYVERYCWFPFNTGTHFTTGWDEVNRVPTNTIPSLVGTIYKNINNTTPVNSTPAIPAATVNVNNSLNLSSYPNIALNKPATASSFLTLNGIVYGADKAVDGDKTTANFRWIVDFPTTPLPAWIEVDLQGSFLVESFRITENTNTVKNFIFQVWDAALSSGTGGWADALTVTNNPATPLITFRSITPVNTTKVRLFVTVHNATDRMRLFELEVYGTPSSPVWTGNTSTSWTTASNWSTNTVPSTSNNVLINGGATFQPTILASTTINSLIIASGATLTVTAPNFTVIGAIDNDGTMSLANNSNLHQGEEFNPNTGNISISRNSSALRRLDYTIWSSPVENQNLLAFSPLTSLNRFYNYNQTTNVYNFIANPATTNFGLAAGHLIRMPNTHPTTATVWNGTFTGVPNNGSISRVVTYRNEAPLNFGFNMIGNPYPSTLNAGAFIAENSSKIESTLYFWRKTNAVLGSAYATWNALGGTASGAGSATPNGTIQVGQGFFVRAKPGTDLTRTTFNQTLTFDNGMRKEDTSIQFFKTKQADVPDRIWLNLTNVKGVFSQTLVGYIANATLGVDDFDGRYINDSPVALTSLINGEEYTIQSRPKFDPKDVVPLSFKTDVNGDYNIALDNFDGVFANGQDIYLMDNLTGIETNLKAGSYTFVAVAGIYKDRFSLKYQKSLNVLSSNFNENNIIVYKDNGTIFVKSTAATIKNIKIYDIQGRLITEKDNVNTHATSLNMALINQVLIVKITADDNTVVAKKIVN